MELKTYISPMTPEQRDEFAAKCETTKGHIQNVMYGMKSCATDLSVLIERNSDYQVRRWELRPDDWFKHWPELIGSKGAPKAESPTNDSESAAGNVARAA